MRSMFISTIAMSAILSGCATTSPKFVTMSNKFNVNDVSWAKHSGNNKIVGSFLSRTVGGDVKTCAGLDVFLVPLSSYSEERIRIIYGNSISGYRSATNLKDLPPEAPADYAASRRITKCDAQGEFTFSDLPDGSYFVTTTVTWGVPGQYVVSTQGGNLMKRIDLSGGKIERIVVTW
jgi:hypothetical protein